MKTAHLCRWIGYAGCCYYDSRPEHACLKETEPWLTGAVVRLYP
jgi:hypothetical protein